MHDGLLSNGKLNPIRTSRAETGLTDVRDVMVYVSSFLVPSHSHLHTIVFTLVSPLCAASMSIVQKTLILSLASVAFAIPQTRLERRQDPATTTTDTCTVGPTSSAVDCLYNFDGLQSSFCSGFVPEVTTTATITTCVPLVMQELKTMLSVVETPRSPSIPQSSARLCSARPTSSQSMAVRRHNSYARC